MSADADLQAILRANLKQFLDEDLDRRIQREPFTAVYDPTWEPGATETADEADLRAIRNAQDSLRRDLKMNTLDDLVLIAARRLLKSHNLPEDLLGRLSYGLLETAIKGWEAVERRTLGTEPLVLSNDTATASTPLPAPAMAQQAAPSPPVPALPLASSFAEAFSDWCRDSSGLRAGPHRQAQVSVAMFLEIVGDKPIDQFTPADGELLRTTLRKLPAVYRKSPKDKGKSIQTIIDEAPPDAPKLAEKTIKRHFWAASRFFEFLTETGRLPRTHQNPVRGFTFKAKGPARTQNDMWSGDELVKLFAAPIWTGCKRTRRAEQGDEIIRDALFWLPLLGLYHGNRLEEFAQLRRSDVGQEDGVWFLNITDEDGRSIKNEQSRRKVPLHSELMRMGFLQYVEATAPAPKDSLFPELKPEGVDSKLGYKITKQFTRYRQIIGVYRKGLNYHSFRHGVTTKLYAADVNEGWIDLLTGHEGGGESRKRYLKGVPMPKLKEAIEKVTWPELDLSGLYVDGM
ncbi:site-specific integrase [Acidocella aromatica]|uniref:Integrase n=1 Tax=Acidocella aromatica TaxID=1303579 RepID=A0A840VBR7_9PROT|nr:site-specific integrase [Acidocella aromatica]MBB5372287.1 integrase [Acidocella aromatica]